jgi:hypothetical protein
MIITIIILAVLFALNMATSAGNSNEPMEEFRRLEDQELRFRKMQEYCDKAIDHYKFVA